MNVRVSLGWMLVGLALLTPAAHGADSAVETEVQTPTGETSQEPSALQLQEKVVDESEDLSKEPKASLSELQAVHAEVEVLRDQWNQSLTRSYPYTVVQSNRPLVISGLGQLRYDHTFDQIANTPDTFSIPFFQLTFAGNLKRDYLEGKNVDYQLGISTVGTTISITDAWLAYQVFNSLDAEGPHLSITGGQQKKNFGIEATATEAFLPAIKLAQFANNLGLAPRDVGLQLAGDLLPRVDYGYNYRVPLIQYWLGAIDGDGPNVLDNNNSKDIFARLQFNAPVRYDHPLRGLSLGVSGYDGWDTKTATNTTNTTASLANSSGGGSTIVTTATSSSSITRDGKKNRLGADIAYVNTPVGFTFEYVTARDEATPTNGTTSKGATVSSKPVSFKEVNEESYTFTLFYQWGDQFVTAAKNQDRYDDYYPLTYQPFFRFDRFVADTSNYGGTGTDIYTAGFNWFFAQTTKLQLNYNVKPANALAPRSNEALAQFQFGF